MTDSDVVCASLPYEKMDALATSHPALHATLLRNIRVVGVATLRVVNAQVAHLTR